jgi:membrane protease YdiL (CAAX protease family)
MTEISNSTSRGLRRFFRSPDGRLRAGWRILGQFLFLQVLSIPIALFIGVLVAVLPGVYLESLIGGVLDETALAIGQATNFVAMLSSVFLARRLLDRRSLRSLGLHLRGQAARDLLAGVAMTLPIMAFIFFAELAAGWLTIEGLAWQAQPPWAWLPALLGLLGVFVMVGFGEEITFRGYWLQNIAEGLNVPWAIVISSLGFALAHLLNPGISFMAILGLLAAGLLFAYAYYRTGALWLPIGIHIGWNFFEGPVFGFQVSGLEAFRLVEQTVQGPVLITGGAFGPEAGLILVPALLLGAGLIALYTRSRTPSQFIKG